MNSIESLTLGGW